MTYIHVEVFVAAHLLGEEQDTFSADDLRQRVLREFGDKRSGVSTHISSRCVANTELNHGTGYNYLWRIQDDEFRLFRPGLDEPEAARIESAHQPRRIDVPERYWHLLR